jgi:hypothetical protein
MESPVFRLPTELTMLIFRHCSSEIRNRLILTHTCRRWRCIAINDAALWTSISIQTVAVKENERLEYLSLLGMQLDRTANLLLDVEFYIPNVADEFSVAVLQLLCQKAPFSRWRTLEMQTKPRSRRIAAATPWSADDAPWSAADAFTNLESLLVCDGNNNPIIRAIDHRITSRLKYLEVNGHGVAPEDLLTCFAKSLTHISTLCLDYLLPMPYRSFLSVNVVNLELGSAYYHFFPHIQTYTLIGCSFTQTSSVDLRSMTTLIVTNILEIEYNVQVSLPALRELKLGHLKMMRRAKIEAPALDILYFMTPWSFRLGYESEELSETDRSFSETGYLLSPNASIMSDSYLPSNTLIHLLAKSPKVTHATLRFDNWTDAQAVLERLVGFGAESELKPVNNVHLCPRLSELRLDFGWGLSESSASKEWLLEWPKRRRAAGLLTHLSIYVMWRWERTYVLLTDD